MTDAPVDRAVVVVSGLPRSGTSMMMHMLSEGGLPILTDGVREADADNPHGYFEYEPVKSLKTNSDWVSNARGKAVKVVSPLLRHLPQGFKYRVIYLRRAIREILASQACMIARRREDKGADDAELELMYRRHLREVESHLLDDDAFRPLFVEHRRLIDYPEPEAAKIADHLGRGLDVAKMCAAVDASLYRSKFG